MLGPMVIVGVRLEKRLLRYLKRFGVKDSKKLTAVQRSLIASKIRQLPGVLIHEEVIMPIEIDEAVRDRSINLNGLEINRMARIIDALSPDEVFIDLIGRSEEKFSAALESRITCRPKITARHKADDTYIITAAASIIAKTRRDAEIALLSSSYAERFGPMGSGYPGDPLTKVFIKKAFHETHLFRTSWSTYETEYEQRRSCAMIEMARQNGPPLQS